MRGGATCEARAVNWASSSHPYNARLSLDDSAFGELPAVASSWPLWSKNQVQNHTGDQDIRGTRRYSKKHLEPRWFDMPSVNFDNADNIRERTYASNRIGSHFRGFRAACEREQFERCRASSADVRASIMAVSWKNGHYIDGSTGGTYLMQCLGVARAALLRDGGAAPHILLVARATTISVILEILFVIIASMLECTSHFSCDAFFLVYTPELPTASLASFASLASGSLDSSLPSPI
ncbi:hypothetical protein EVAR_29285_1 [Eumeta japonica]|uniref:Uncharacterized protein n=1 Tax=Eumeta variegata TaxID=151549 RepID=A0A4C1VVR6_EUMVA|nr:hypothetical protein EVAR_29285_1 [Eumeta japonica]